MYIEQQATKPNAEIQIKAPGLSSRPDVYFLQGFEYYQTIIKTGIYFNEAFHHIQHAHEKRKSYSLPKSQDKVIIINNYEWN